MRSLAIATFFLAVSALPGLAADLRGHGGPVRSIAVEGDAAITASFDSTAILWSLSRSAALAVLRGHEGAVNAALALGDGLFATGGEDGKVLLWRAGAPLALKALSGHSAPVSALARSRDGARFASASWDGTVRLWSRDGAAEHVLGGHSGNVNGVAFFADGAVASAAYDGMLRVFNAEGRPETSFNLGAPLSALTIAPDGEMIVAAADGKLRFVDRTAGLRATLDIAETPLVALALAPDGKLVGAAGFRGALALVERSTRDIARRLDGPAFPLWSLAFSPEGDEILTGGADRLVRRWLVATGEPASPAVAPASDDVPPRLKDHPGAEVFRACVACHTLTPDGGNRAGPTLAGLFGRRIGTAAGYDFSAALKGMDIIWTAETVQKLFEIGPNAYTPGTKMPEQKIIRAEDRQALTEFLRLADQR